MFLLKVLVYLLVGNDFLLEDICTCFGRFHHLDAFGVVTTGVTGLQAFFAIVLNLFQNRLLLNFLVQRILLEDWVVLHEFQSVGSILAVFGRDVSRRTGHTAGLVLCALQDDLNSCFFTFLCHSVFLLFFIRRDTLFRRRSLEQRPIRFC